jgi:hypothetical protein
MFILEVFRPTATIVPSEFTETPVPNCIDVAVPRIELAGGTDTEFTIDPPEIESVFMVVVLTVPACMLVVTSAFDATTFPRTFRVVPEGADVLTPTRAETDRMFMVVAFTVVAKMFVVWTALDTTTFPRTFMVAPAAAALMPNPVAATTLCTLPVPAKFAVWANMFVVWTALDV